MWGMRMFTSEATRSAPPVATMRLSSRTYAVSSSMVLQAASTVALASCAERLAVARARSARGELARRVRRFRASEGSRRCAAMLEAAAAFRLGGTGSVITCTRHVHQLLQLYSCMMYSATPTPTHKHTHTQTPLSTQWQQRKEVAEKWGAHSD